MPKKVEDYMTPISEVAVVTTDMSMMDVLKEMIKKNSRDAIVTDANHELQGIITGTDFLREARIAIEGGLLHEGTARNLMTPRPVPIPKGTLMFDTVDVMFRSQKHSLIVTEGFKPSGIITQLDVIKWWVEEYGAKGKGSKE